MHENQFGFIPKICSIHWLFDTLIETKPVYWSTISYDLIHVAQPMDQKYVPFGKKIPRNFKVWASFKPWNILSDFSVLNKPLNTCVSVIRIPNHSGLCSQLRLRKNFTRHHFTINHFDMPHIPQTVNFAYLELFLENWCIFVFILFSRWMWNRIDKIRKIEFRRWEIRKLYCVN